MANNPPSLSIDFALIVGPKGREASFGEIQEPSSNKKLRRNTMTTYDKGSPDIQGKMSLFILDHSVKGNLRMLEKDE
jgi:hypothetical protein